METINLNLNHNTYKFSNPVNSMTKINDKELSTLTLKELEFYLEALQDKINELKAEDDIKHGRVFTKEEAREYLLKCIREEK